MKKEYQDVDFDELEIMDLDEEDVTQVADTDIDIEEVDLEEETLVQEQAMEDASEEFQELLDAEEPYVVPIVETEKAQKEASLEEYDDAEEAFGSTKSPKEDDGAFAGGFIERLLHMDTMDKIIAGLGLVVLVLACVALGFFLTFRSSENQILAFADTGKNLENITFLLLNLFFYKLYFILYIIYTI